MYTVDGFITMKISRKELELMVNSITVMTLDKDKQKDFNLYNILLQELKDVEQQWHEEENKYYSNKKPKTK